MNACIFGPANEPWSCSVHHGIRTSLDEPLCDIARPAEPFTDAHLDNLRRGIAEGRNPGSRYNIRRLLATIELARAASKPDDAGGIDVERLAWALCDVHHHSPGRTHPSLRPCEHNWLQAERVADAYAARLTNPEADR